MSPDQLWILNPKKLLKRLEPPADAKKDFSKKAEDEADLYTEGISSYFLSAVIFLDYFLIQRIFTYLLTG